MQTPTIAVGSRLTDYGNLDLTVEGLASGGMGLVVWGRNAARGHQTLALKLMLPERLAAARSLEHRRAIERQFEDEALVWCHLWYHPCVVTTYGLTRLPGLDNLPVLQLEYQPNGSLRDQLRLGRAEHTHPSLRAALAWAIHTASALAHIHQPDPEHDRPAPLVHSDLKPENVLLDAHGWAQLTDLGLTRAYAALAVDSGIGTGYGSAEASTASRAPALTSQQAEVARLRAILQAAGAVPAEPSWEAEERTTLFATHTLRIPGPPLREASDNEPAAAAIGVRGPVAGSPPYMAPEQWLGLDAVVPATDLYAFGVLLYELFAGTEAPYPFPFDPTAYITPEVYSHALATGYDPALLAWHAAHTAPAGPAHRLNDPDITEAALRSGPLAELAERAGGAGRRAAVTAIHRLDALIMACLAPDPAYRPRAADVQRQIAALALDPLGLEPIQAPQPTPTSPRNEGVFWSNLGNTYGRLARNEEALVGLRRAVQHEPLDPINWVNLGAALSTLGRQEREQENGWAAGATAARQHFEEALAAYQQAEVRLTPEVLAEYPALLPGLSTNQGGVLSNLGRHAEAVAAYRRALALQPDKSDTRFNIALAYARWSQESHATHEERLERLHAAQREIGAALAAAPGMSGGRSLAERIARALADPAHRFQG